MVDGRYALAAVTMSSEPWLHRYLGIAQLKLLNRGTSTNTQMGRFRNVGNYILQPCRFLSNTDMSMCPCNFHAVLSPVARQYLIPQSALSCTFPRAGRITVTTLVWVIWIPLKGKHAHTSCQNPGRCVLDLWGRVIAFQTHLYDTSKHM